MNFSNFKLIIWDLDDTLWNGVLSEGDVSISLNNIELINRLVDNGIMCSICSKNDADNAENKLKEFGIFDCFVFNSINWSSKGERVKQIISQMNLREENVLFVDDNCLNRNEVLSFCPEISVSDEKIISQMYAWIVEQKEKDHDRKRLQQYKLLEKKNDFKAKSASNFQFLFDCNISVKILYDCKENKSRILELINRTNQLNYTKIRCSENELSQLLDDKVVKCGYVNVTDNFGDYGLVGFFAVKKNKLVHFLFSCRVLNMGVEQYVYRQLGCPNIDIVQPVSSELPGVEPKWINKKTPKEDKKSKSKLSGKIVIKGPCDMEQMFSFIEPSKNIITEFSYVNDKGIWIEHHNHTTQIINSLILDDCQKKEYSLLPFCDERMYETCLFDDDVDIAMISLFNDPHLGIYKDKKTGNIMSFGEYLVDFTDENNWDKIINREYFTAKHQFTTEELRDFKENFTYCGRLTPIEILNNLKWVLGHLNDKAILVLCLGSETELINADYHNHESYCDRHLFHRKLNNLVREWAKENERVKLVDVNKYIKSQDDFLNTINHLKKPIYYEMSKDFIDIVSVSSNVKISNKKEGKSIKKVNGIFRNVKSRMVILYEKILKNIVK